MTIEEKVLDIMKLKAKPLTALEIRDIYNMKYPSTQINRISHSLSVLSSPGVRKVIRGGKKMERYGKEAILWRLKE
jgi:hypothetical protein